MVKKIVNLVPLGLVLAVLVWFLFIECAPWR